ncbi:MAG: hypothetical protein J6T12_06425 [Salinivirgaceae bacterium]|nr:hypothetical protein [Salinivirgaceae bacterium]
MKAKLLIVCTIICLFTSCDGLLPQKVGNESDAYTEDYPAYIEDNPDNYQSYIEDVVKYNIALANAVIENSNRLEGNVAAGLLYNDYGDIFDGMFNYYLNRISDLDDTVNDLWLNEEGTDGYQAVLTKLSNNPNYQNNDIASDVLDVYRNTRIIISEYVQVPTSSQTKLWQFKELTTGIRFYFCIHEKDDFWECYPDDDSYDWYFSKNL